MEFQDFFEEGIINSKNRKKIAFNNRNPIQKRFALAKTKTSEEKYLYHNIFLLAKENEEKSPIFLTGSNVVDEIVKIFLFDNDDIFELTTNMWDFVIIPIAHFTLIFLYEKKMDDDFEKILFERENFNLKDFANIIPSITMKICFLDYNLAKKASFFIEEISVSEKENVKLFKFNSSQDYAKVNEFFQFEKSNGEFVHFINALFSGSPIFQVQDGIMVIYGLHCKYCRKYNQNKGIKFSKEDLELIKDNAGIDFIENNGVFTIFDN